MKINKTKLLFIATLFFLAIPLVFATGNAQAYVGQLQCLKCHEPLSHPGEADKTPFMMTGHSNMLRSVAPGVELLGPNGVHYSDPGFDWASGTYNGNTLYYIWDGWLGFESNPNTNPRTMVTGGTYTCGSCHTTGYVATNNVPGMEPENTFPGITGVTGSWVYNGVKCERCHGEATYDENAVTDGSTVLDASYLKYRQTFPGTDTDGDGNACDYGGSTGTTSVDMYSNDYNSQLGTVNGINYGTVADAHFFDVNGNPVTPAAVYDNTGATPGAACEQPRPRGVHHGGTFNLTTGAPAYLPANGAEQNSLCGECHNGSHANGFMNSPHARFSGTWGQLADTTQYESHFTTYYGGCSGCHDVHQSLVAENAEPFHKTCGVSCHSNRLNNVKHPVGPGTPLSGDLTTDEGVLDACSTCHMKGSGNHLFRINTDKTYSYDLDVTQVCSNPTYTTITDCTDNGGSMVDNNPADVATCTSQGGHVGSSHGALVCLDASGAHMGRFSAEGDFAEAEWVDLNQACGQCHGGSGTAKAGVPHMDLDQLEAYAEGMHGASTSAPTAKTFLAGSGDVEISDYTVTFSDASTNADHAPATDMKVTVNWGDGNVSTGVGGSVFSHTYTTAATFHILHTVSLNNLFNTETINVVVPSAVLGGGTVGVQVDDYNAAGLADVSLYLKQNGITKKLGATDSTGTFTFMDVPSGTYDLIAYKYGVLLSSTDCATGTVTVNAASPAPTCTFTQTQTQFNLTVTATEGHVVTVKQAGVTKGIQKVGVSGSVSFGRLAAGSYTVDGYMFGSTCDQAAVTLGPDTAITLTCP